MRLARSLVRVPAFSLTVIITFAAATAVTAMTFALVWHILVRDLPFRDPDRLANVWNRYGRENVQSTAISAPDYNDRKTARSFEDVMVYRREGVTLGSEMPQRLIATKATANFFQLLGVDGPALRDGTAVVSDRLRRRLGNPATLRLGGSVHRVIAVMPPAFAYPDREVEVWLPLELTPEDIADENRGSENLYMVARLREGVTMAQAQAEMDAITAAVRNRVPTRTQYLIDSRWHVSLFSLRDELVGNVRRALWILFGAAALVMLLAAANVTGLFVARTAARRKEIAVRAALGAGRFRLARELAAEVAALAVTGAVLGLVIAMIATPFVAQTGLPRAQEVRVDVAVVLFSLVVALIMAGLIAAGLGAWSTARQAPLAESARGATASLTTSRIRMVLVAAQVAIAVTLLASGALLVESYRRLRGVETGFQPGNTLTFRANLPAQGFITLQERLAQAPSVEAVSFVSELPFSNETWTMTFGIEGRLNETDNGSNVRMVTPGYAATMKIPVVRGRMIDANDRLGGPRVAVIDEAAAKRYWPNDDPVGKRLSFSPRDPSRWRTIVGVIGSVRHASLTQSAEPHIYISAVQGEATQLYGVVRTTGDPMRLAGDLRAIVRSIDPASPVYAIQTMEQYLDAAASQPRLRATLVGVFAAIGLLLAIIGLYGLLAFIVASRTREVGLRMALGATAPEIVRFVTQWALKVTAIGLVAGMAGAALMTRTMHAVLFGVDDVRVSVYLAVALLFGLVAMAASIVPALRAARIDPAVALRQD